MAPILYSFRRCPYAMRARMAITISKTPVRLREILLRDKPDAMLEASEKGTVPVVIEDDRVIDESIDVMHWALSNNDPEGWLANSTDPLVKECDEKFKHHLDRYKYATRYDDIDPEDHRTAGFAFLLKLEAVLEDQPYLCGEHRSFSDIAIFPFVRQFRIADMAWFDASDIPNVQRWLTNLMTSALFTDVMKKYPLWKDTGEEFAFPEG